MTSAPKWSIINVELTAPPTSPLVSDGSSAIWVIIRIAGAVVGLRRFLAAELPLSPSEIVREASKAAAASALGWLSLSGDFAAASPQTSPTHQPLISPPEPRLLAQQDLIGELKQLVDKRRNRQAVHSASIVICTCYRPDAIRDCLASISAEISAGREVVVVDNGPDPETEAIVRAVPGVRYVAEPLRGLSQARNTGIEAISNEIAIFIDDDVRPEPGWIDGLLPAFNDPRVSVACGLVLPDELGNDAQIAFQEELGFGGMGLVPIRFDAVFRRAFRFGVPVWHVGAGANMAVRKSAAEQLGGFDPRIGPGAAGGCGDDSEFWHRSLFAGDVLVYEPLSVVRHQHRRDWPALKRQAYGYGLGHMVALFAQYAHDGDKGDLVRAFYVLPKWYFGRLLRLPRRRQRGNPDRLLMSLIAGYVASFRHLGLIFGRFHSQGPSETQRAK